MKDANHRRTDTVRRHLPELLEGVNSETEGRTVLTGAEGRRSGELLFNKYTFQFAR